MTTYARMYRSTAEVMAATPSKENIGKYPNGFDAWYGFSKRDLGGLTNIKELIALVNYGWKDGAKLAKKAFDELSSIVPKTRSVHRRKIRGDFGDELDMQRVYTGDLDTAWSKMHRRFEDGTQGNPVTILVNIGGLVGTTAEEFFWRGAVARVAAERLEAAGRRVEIIAYSYSRGSYKTGDALTGVLLKELDQPLNEEVLVATTAHPAFFRQFILNARLAEKAIIKPDFGATAQGLPERKHFGISKNAEVIGITDMYSEQDAKKFLTNITKGELK